MYVHLSESGFIDFNEFVDIMNNCGSKDPEEQMKDAFKVFDADGSGKISSDELKKVGLYLY